MTDLAGRRIGFGRALSRWLAALLSYLTLYIGFFMAGFTARKQALHDYVAGTLVVDRWAFSEHPERQRRNLGAGVIVLAAVVPLVLVAIWESSPRLPCRPIRTTRCAQKSPKRWCMATR